MPRINTPELMLLYLEGSKGKLEHRQKCLVDKLYHKRFLLGKHENDYISEILITSEEAELLGLPKADKKEVSEVFEMLTNILLNPQEEKNQEIYRTFINAMNNSQEQLIDKIITIEESSQKNSKDDLYLNNIQMSLDLIKGLNDRLRRTYARETKKTRDIK